MRPSVATFAEASVATARQAEAALVSDILGGDAHALERLMRQNNRRLFRVARSILRDDSEAEDAVQETYIQAYRSLAGFRGDAGLATWLTRIIVNQALERRRRKQLPEADATASGETAETGAGDFAETPETLAMRSELRRCIETAIDSLPETQRTVFMLRAVEGLSVEETANALGISAANTKVRLLRARDQLRTALGERLGPLIESVFAFDGRRCDRLVCGVFARLGLGAPSLAAGSPRGPIKQHCAPQGGAAQSPPAPVGEGT